MQPVAGVRKRLGDGQVSVVERHVFADKADVHSICLRPDLLDHMRPLLKIGRRRLDLKLP